MAELLCRQLRARADQRHRLRRRLDAAHHRRADHPHCRHPAAAARQHRPARRRHHGHARPFQHPGLDRRRRRSTTCCPATCRSPPPTSEHETLDEYVEHEGLPNRLLGQLPQVHRQPAQGLVRRRGHAPTTTICFTWLPRHRRRLFATADVRPHGQAARSRATSCWARTPAAAGPTPGLHRAGLRNLDWLVVRRLVRDRERRLLEERPGRPAARRDQDRGLLHSRRRGSPRRRARSPTPSGCSSGTTRRSTRRATAAPTPGSSTTSGKRLKELYAGSTDPRDQPLLRLTWDYDFDGPQRLPDGTLSRIEGEPDVEKVLQEINGYKLTRSTRAPAGRSCCPASAELKDDGIDGVRLLDLQRRLSRAGPQPGRASGRRPTTRCSRTGASPGRTIAGSCTTAPRPTPTAGPGRSARS